MLIKSPILNRASCLHYRFFSASDLFLISSDDDKNYSNAPMKCIDTTISLANRLQQQHIAHISKRSLADNSDTTINFSKKRPSGAKAKSKA